MNYSLTNKTRHKSLFWSLFVCASACGIEKYIINFFISHSEFLQTKYKINKWGNFHEPKRNKSMAFSFSPSPRRCTHLKFIEICVDNIKAFSLTIIFATTTGFNRVQCDDLKPQYLKNRTFDLCRIRWLDSDSVILSD